MPQDYGQDEIGAPPIVQSSIFEEIENAGRFIEKPARAKTIAHGACPTCSNNKVGLVFARGSQCLAWKDHYLTTHGGHAMQCRSVGQHLCDCPARDVTSLTGLDTPVCPHDRN